MLTRLLRRTLSIIFILGLLSPVFVHADTTAPWLSPDNPLLGMPDQIAAGSLPSTVSGYGNVDCHEHKFVTRPARYLVQSEENHTACAVTGESGEIDPGGYVELNGTHTSGQMQTAAGNTVFISPVPNSRTLATMSSTSSGVVLVFYDEFAQNFSSTNVALDGKVTYKLAPTPSWILKDHSGNTIFVRADSIAYSANGKWLVADVPHVATIRVNLETHEIIPFQTPNNYDLGQDPQAQTSVSDDGRYVLTGSRFGGLKITDVSTCAAVPDHITGPVGCQAKDLTQFLRQTVHGYLWSLQPRFINDNLVSFYALYDPGDGSRAVYKYRMVPAGQQIVNQDYIALGDSYSAGQGTFNYFPETDSGKSLNDCHTSPISYPYLIGQQLQLNSYHNVACSGARIQDITTPQIPKDIPNNSLGEWLPGRKPQLQYIQEGHPNTVTISIVGNDVGFDKILKNCVNFGVIPITCYSSYEDRLELVNTINNQFSGLVNNYQKVKGAAKQGSNIYVFGYPKIAQDDGNCAVNVRFNNDEIKFSNLLISYINNVVQSAAQRAGVHYVDITDALIGHKLCETVSNNVAMNGVTAGKDTPFEKIGPIAAESYHPNKLGQQLYKDAILAQTNNFTASTPAADPAAAPPAINDALPILQNVPKTGRAINNTINADDTTGDIATISNSTPLVVNGAEYGLKPNSGYQIELHSTPVQLGSFATDALGNLSTSVTIPVDTPIGFHVLHIYGQNKAGEAIDLQKTIYVAGSSTDYDGDGVANAADSCPTVQQSGQDQDKDGIDDACDGFIDKAPDPTPPPPPTPTPPPMPVPQPPSIGGIHEIIQLIQRILLSFMKKIIILITKFLWFLR